MIHILKGSFWLLDVSYTGGRSQGKCPCSCSPGTTQGATWSCRTTVPQGGAVGLGCRKTSRLTHLPTRLHSTGSISHVATSPLVVQTTHEPGELWLLERQSPIFFIHEPKCLVIYQRASCAPGRHQSGSRSTGAAPTGLTPRPCLTCGSPVRTRTPTALLPPGRPDRDGSGPLPSGRVGRGRHVQVTCNVSL